MIIQTNEQAIESAIEKALTGTSLEELQTSGNESNEPSIVSISDMGFYFSITNNFNANAWRK